MSFLENYESDFYYIWHKCSASAPNFTTNFREVKVKVQGHIRCTENLPVVVVWPWFDILTKFKNPTDIALL